MLNPQTLTRYVERFNSIDKEAITNAISNHAASNWLLHNIPLLDCPDREIEETYYFRWWSFRKHLVRTPAGYVITEFLTPVRHAGSFNTISCAAGFHIAEGRWLHDDQYLNDYIRFWIRGNNGAPQTHFHNYSNWFASAVWNRYLVNGNKEFIVKLLPDLQKDFRMWSAERQRSRQFS